MRLTLLLLFPFVLACPTDEGGGFGNSDDDDDSSPQEETDKIVGFVELEDSPLAGGSLRSLSDPAISTETDGDGRFEVGFVDPATFEGLRLDHPDASLTDVWIDVAVQHPEDEELFILLLTPERLQTFYGEFGLILDGEAVTVQVGAKDSLGGDLPGVTIALSADHQGAFFRGENGPEPGDVTHNDPAGIVFANVTAGPVQVLATHPDLTCIVPPMLTVEASTKVDVSVRCQ